MKFAYLIGLAACASGSYAALASGPSSPFPPAYDKAYAAYLTALPPDARKLGWLTRLDQVASPARPLKMGTITVLYLFGCKQHACDTDQANVFLLPDKTRVMAVIKLNGVQKLIGGAGPREAACVKKLDASGGVAPSC
ncbi:MAG: hypothetical protein QHC40_01705 [Sphingobium sp.]|nr:hypothetical protein [Sphingobium sp.]